MSAPTLPEQLRAQNVLGDLQHLIQLAEQGSGMRVTLATAEFSHAVLKSVGGSTPGFWIIPKDLLSAEATQMQTQKLSFTLKRRTAVAAARSFDDDLAQAVQALRAGLLALAPLAQDFMLSARAEFRFELSREGKLSFFLSAGGKSSDANTLALELSPAP